MTNEASWPTAEDNKLVNGVMERFSQIASQLDYNILFNYMANAAGQRHALEAQLKASNEEVARLREALVEAEGLVGQAYMREALVEAEGLVGQAYITMEERQKGSPIGYNFWDSWCDRARPIFERLEAERTANAAYDSAPRKEDVCDRPVDCECWGLVLAGESFGCPYKKPADALNPEASAEPGQET